MRMRVWAASPLRGSSRKNCRIAEEGQGEAIVARRGNHRCEALEQPLERVMQAAVGQVDASMALAREAWLSLPGCVVLRCHCTD